MKSNLRIVIGYDTREAVAYHVFCQSILDNISVPIEIIPLVLHSLKDYDESHKDQSNDFIYSRFLTPYINEFNGWAIFADGDMICQADIKELWDMRDSSKAVQVVKHDYKTKAHIKYLGNINEDYPKKNWSSLVIWNCAHPKNKILTPEFVSQQTGKFLHRFSWLDDEDIGELPKEWNWLEIEYPKNTNAKIIHYTLGTPCFINYRNTDTSDIWLEYFKKINQGMENY